MARDVPIGNLTETSPPVSSGIATVVNHSRGMRGTEDG
jgi:hypothetical protein